MTSFQDLREAINSARQRSIALKWTPNNVPEFREEAKAETAAWTVVFDLLDELQEATLKDVGDIGSTAVAIEGYATQIVEAAGAILGFLDSGKSPV